MLYASLPTTIQKQKIVSCMRLVQKAHHVLGCLPRMAQSFRRWICRQYPAQRWDLFKLRFQKVGRSCKISWTILKEISPSGYQIMIIRNNISHRPTRSIYDLRSSRHKQDTIGDVLSFSRQTEQNCLADVSNDVKKWEECFVKSYCRITLRRLVGRCITNLQPILRRPTYFWSNECALTDRYTYKQLLFTYAQINRNWHLHLLITISIWHRKISQHINWCRKNDNLCPIPPAIIKSVSIEFCQILASIHSLIQLLSSLLFVMSAQGNVISYNTKNRHTAL